MADRIIAVMGATGAQGGGLVRAIAAEAGSGFKARAVTRHADSDKARALAAPGVEVVSADAGDERSLERAFAGAYGVYCVTFFWEHNSPAQEIAQATAMARAAKAAGAQHVIWSTLEDTRRWVPLDDDRMPTLMGKYKVPHLDSKGEADAVFRDLGLPTTFLLTSFYWDNFIHFGMGPRRGADGVLALTLPMGEARLSGIAAEDIGRCAYGIFKRGKEPIGQRIGIAGEHLTGAQMASTFTKALGEPVRYTPISPEAYRALGFPGAEDLGNMFQFYQEFEAEFAGVRDIERTRRLNPLLQNFETWLVRNKTRIPLA